MSAQDYGLIQALVIVFVLIFDAIDLHPQIGSFGFLRSFSYWAYFAVRLVLSSVAALLVYNVDQTLFPPVIALIGVIASVTILQSLSLNVGGKDIANLNNLLDVYRQKMISDESERRAARDDANVLELMEKLLQKYDVTGLEKVLRQMLLQARWASEEINEHIERNKESAAGDKEYLEAIFASEVADMNQNYARRLTSK